ncbi:hypothetical protein [Intestinibacter bartlettii]|jgi:hypothetical protein|uniref:hypothetical protein n=1 Tax=Intestinibacter bartlettii TaxID=261299 RepID=UPI0001631567|nr:hypothetical protein [Intestinibacter bartlettii]MDU1252697.1 hypothetical protein [Peptostreptococcaceae bacterium]EDQ96091.1 hypothetical protein CLOBAR_01858 [Intestinibacter bartlettii DSM 16795]MCB5744823.1 hypothetical protein [Intestinibacter bartlettii]MCC2705759.1 hypothetical protein [Intestinibacter bartlettii]MCC2761209.1 hypothetical protein [Intestinibacter bartlettii]
MDPLVVIIQGQQFKLKNLNNLVASIFGKSYFDLSQEERLKVRYEKAHAISQFHKYLPIVNTEQGTYGDNFDIVKKDYDFENAFIIDDDYSYILSLCKINSFMLLEVRNSNIFTGLIDKSEIKDDLVVINHFAKEILGELYN